MQGDHSRLWNGRCFLECHTGRFPCQGLFRSADILGKTTMIPWQFPVYLISRLKVPDVPANRFHSPGYVRSEYRVTWSSKSPHANIQRSAYQSFPIRPVYGYCMNFDQ